MYVLLLLRGSCWFFFFMGVVEVFVLGRVVYLVKGAVGFVASVVVLVSN